MLDTLYYMLPTVKPEAPLIFKGSHNIILDNLTTLLYIINMKTLQVGELKSNFSKVLDYVKNGEEVTIYSHRPPPSEGRLY